MRTSAICLVTLIACLALAVSPAFCGDDQVVSLRKGVPLTAESAVPPPRKLVTGDPRVPRTFAQQPPVIPHSVADYQVSLKQNDCLNCHGEDYGAGAPVVSESHFRDREGKRLSQVAKNRYFCNQCHAPLTDAGPLVENTFEGAK